MSAPCFARVEIGELENKVGPSPMNTLFNVGDVNGDGWTDIITSGRDGRMAWFENKLGRGWERHIVAEVAGQECGGLVYPLAGRAGADIINGGDWRSDELSWWENPGPGGGTWRRHVIARTGQNQFHDEAVGDVTGDGQVSLVFWNQGGGALYRVPIPRNPFASPWPGIERIASNVREGQQPEEGLALADLDNDGRNEVIAGQHWYKHTGKPGAPWECHRYARGYITTVIAVGDLDGDGQKEIVFAEGDPCIYGHPDGGRLAWLKPRGDRREMWEEHVLDEHLMDAHSVQLGDLCGNGRLDILVGEIGVKETLQQRPPRLMVYENLGAGRFVRQVIDEGIGTHHARLADFRHRGALDIASRPLHGPDRWKVFVWENNRA